MIWTLSYSTAVRTYGCTDKDRIASCWCCFVSSECGKYRDLCNHGPLQTASVDAIAQGNVPLHLSIYLPLNHFHFSVPSHVLIDFSQRCIQLFL